MFCVCRFHLYRGREREREMGKKDKVDKQGGKGGFSKFRLVSQLMCPVIESCPLASLRQSLTTPHYLSSPFSFLFFLSSCFPLFFFLEVTVRLVSCS